MDQCLFCRIISGVYAFRDINPQAPVHILVIPRKHVASMDALDQLSDAEIAACLRAIRTIARQEHLDHGYRVISNCGDDACQSVHHLHFHILGGRAMSEQMA